MENYESPIVTETWPEIYRFVVRNEHVHMIHLPVVPDSSFAHL